MQARPALTPDESRIFQQTQIILTIFRMKRTKHIYSRQIFTGCSGVLAESFDIRNLWSPVSYYIVICCDMGLSRRKCPVFQKTKLRNLIIIWSIIEIWTLNFMFLTRTLAGSVKYIVFGAFFYNDERKKIRP